MSAMDVRARRLHKSMQAREAGIRNPRGDQGRLADGNRIWGEISLALRAGDTLP